MFVSVLVTVLSLWVGNDTAVDVMIRSEEISRVSRYLKQKELQYEVVIEDLQRAIDEENPSLSVQEMEELEGRKGLQHRCFIIRPSSIANSFGVYIGSQLPVSCFPCFIYFFSRFPASESPWRSISRRLRQRNDVSLVTLPVPLTRMAKTRQLV